jgi:EmrB/QacA subfamily drug resistance transporter
MGQTFLRAERCADKVQAMPRLSRIIPLIVASAVFMENMDSTVIATALPAMARDLGTDPVALKLAITTYLLSLTVFIPISGWIADRFGAKLIFRLAMLVFMAGSVACGAAQSLEWLIAARALQGLGGAMMAPVGRILLLRQVPKDQLVDALMWLTIPALMAPLLGPPVGGFITTYFDWRWIFWINVPVGLMGITLATRLMPETEIEAPPPLDGKGFILSAFGLASMVFGFTIIGRDVLPAPIAIGLLLIGAICLLLYVGHAARAPDPILDLALLRSTTFRAGVLGGSLFRIGIGAIPFLVPLMLQIGFNYTPFQSGLMTCSMAVGAIAMKFSTARLLRRFGFRRLLVANGLASSLLIAAYGLLSPVTPIALVLLLFTGGAFLRSLQFTALNALSYADVDHADVAKATSFYAVAQQLSLAAGVAIAAFALESLQWLRGGDVLTAQDFPMAFVIVAGLAALSVMQFRALPRDAGWAVLARPDHEDVKVAPENA